MDGQSLVTLVDTGVQGPDCLRELIPKIGVRLKVYSYIIKGQGPDCLRELIPKIGVRLKVYSYIIKDKEAQATQVSLQMK